MKILVFADTHGKINSTLKIIQEQKKVDMIIHLGDLVRDAEEVEVATGIKTESVCGNNDVFSKEPYQKTLVLGQKKFLITHGHKEKVKQGLEELIREGQQSDVDAVLFGHTHKSHQEIINGILYFNPGSMTHPQDYPSYGIIEIKEGKLYHMICKLI